MYSPHPINLFTRTYKGLKLPHTPSRLYRNSSLGGSYKAHRVFLPMPFLRREKFDTVHEKSTVAEGIPADTGKEGFQALEVSVPPHRSQLGTGKVPKQGTSTDNTETDLAPPPPPDDADEEDDEETQVDDLALQKALKLVQQAMGHPVKVSKVKLNSLRDTSLKGGGKQDEPKAKQAKRKRRDLAEELLNKYNIR